MLVHAWVENDRLLVRLPRPLAVPARRRKLEAPLEPMVQVSVEPAWWRALRLGTPGRHYRFRPGQWCVGELVHAKGRDFVALVEDEPAVVIDFAHWLSPYARLALSVRDPYGFAALLGRRGGAKEVEYGQVKPSACE
ncbi:hypothetical protein SUDANB176_06655 [Streptomyces sp. enrichment culture]|uniref:hypothetical protein n=1 Tax=Streptomyces sp. enrichment culture TaxID=1795815 RepID=UPI003F57338A